MMILSLMRVSGHFGALPMWIVAAGNSSPDP